MLTLGEDENRFHPDRLTEINTALDQVEAVAGAVFGAIKARLYAEVIAELKAV